MANSLNEDLTGKVVVLRKDVMDPDYKHIKWRLFRVDGGFGASPHTMGRALYGVHLIDGEKARWNGEDVERLAADGEISAYVR